MGLIPTPFTHVRIIYFHKPFCSTNKRFVNFHNTLCRFVLLRWRLVLYLTFISSTASIFLVLVLPLLAFTYHRNTFLALLRTRDYPKPFRISETTSSIQYKLSQQTTTISFVDTLSTLTLRFSFEPPNPFMRYPS